MCVDYDLYTTDPVLLSLLDELVSFFRVHVFPAAEVSLKLIVYMERWNGLQ